MYLPFSNFATQCFHKFLGLEPWYKFLKLDSHCNIQHFQVLPGNGQPSDVPLVLIAIVDDLLRIAGLIAVGFIVYGAFQYVGSQGNPDSAKRAQETVVNALLGLVVSIAAIAFVGYIGNKLGG